MNHTHLTDDQLIGMCVDTSDAPADVQTSGCPTCEQRRTSLSALLDEIGDAADDTTDAVFPAARLAKQHARILHRVDLLGNVGRVLTFPAPQPVRATSMLHPKPVRRWVAGAAAAGLLIGMVAGHLVHDIPTFGRTAQTQTALAARQPTAQYGSSNSAADAEFLREIETAVSSGPAGLRRLDQITPIVWAEPR